MSKETIAELFVRLLVEQLQTDKMERRKNTADRSLAFTRRYRKSLKYLSDTMEPPDCVQMMSDTLENLPTR